MWLWVIRAFCVLAVIDLGKGGLIKPCGHIVPESAVLELGSNFTAICILYEECLEMNYEDASHIFWKTKNKHVPKEQYTVLNRTASSVTFNNIFSLDSPLTCNLLKYGQLEQNIYGIQIKLGLPPEKPTGLHCMVNENEKLRCWWNPGRETYLDTHFTLNYNWSGPGNNGTREVCVPPEGVNNTCIYSGFAVFFIYTNVWVEAKNDLGMVTSDVITFDPIDIVKFNPPDNLSVDRSEELPSILKLSWANPLPQLGISLKYNIRYRARNSTAWTQIPPEDTASTRDSFTIQGLKPYTEYVFSIRCIKKDGQGFWSNWSEEVSGFTSEARPSKAPSFWYNLVHPHSMNGYRLIQLMWKVLPPSDANGRILGYYLSLTRQRAPSIPHNYSIDTTSMIVNLTNDPYIATLAVYNRIGRSEDSLLPIPGRNYQATHPVRNIKAFPKDGNLWIEWTAPSRSVMKYVLEWCIESDDVPCTVEWQQEPGTAQHTYLRGKLKPFTCYLITIYPVYVDGPGSPQRVKAYLQQNRPSRGPTVQTKKVSKNEAVLVWHHLPIDEQNGFIRSYTIVYKTSTGNETVVNVNSSHTEYTLSSLTSDTLYMVRMAANTDQGGSFGPEFTFTTPKFAQGEIEAIVVPVCLAFLLTTLLGVLFCFNKRDLIKKHIWPSVPDPSKSHIAQWSPQTPTRHNFNSKDQIYPEGCLTDVSVVELEANDKKPFPEDLKSFDVFKKEKTTAEGHSSGIGGSSCMSSSRQSISYSDDSESAQTTSSTVQYSTVVHGYRVQVPQVFSRSESTQPLLDSEEQPEDLQIADVGSGEGASPRQRYFKQNCAQGEAHPDRSPFERSNPIPPSVNEEDFIRLTQPIPGQSSGPCVSKPMDSGQQGVSAPDVLPSSAKWQGESQEPPGEDLPKSYLPQTVRPGGYVPQ
ncbi:interleukin-6 receptor subunit beta isoform X1 [Ornithorhynchus anatinus]|uniref:interleukin-6 receptor subunit beta isoform X1 n=1 Tax=Ornithorhynchus anatinus TaxID=9258 RepID=UPI0010A9314F|nr:interleukin-6 receptor subunit beta isoform X1 [Ornithorhynchus anatinus]